MRAGACVGMSSGRFAVRADLRWSMRALPPRVPATPAQPAIGAVDVTTAVSPLLYLSARPARLGPRVPDCATYGALNKSHVLLRGPAHTMPNVGYKQQSNCTVLQLNCDCNRHKNLIVIYFRYVQTANLCFESRCQAFYVH